MQSRIKAGIGWREDGAGTRKRALSGALACFGAALSLLAAPYFPAWGAAVATAIMAAAAVLYLGLRREPFDLFEVFVPFSTLYIVYFGVSACYFAIFPEQLRFASLRPYLLPASFLATGGYLAFVAGYALSGSRFTPRLGHLRSPWIAACYGAFGLAGVVSSLSQLAGFKLSGKVAPILSALGHGTPLFYAAWFWWWHRYFSGDRRRGILGSGFVLALMAALILALTFGRKAILLEVTSVPLIALWYARRKFPWRAMLSLCILTVFVIFPVYNTYKRYALVTPEAWALRETLDTVMRWDAEEYSEASVHGVMRRFGTITSVAAVMRDAGHVVDYEYGRTLVLAPISVLIPRFLWPGKPKISLGNEFGQIFHLIHPLDEATAIAPTLVGELYWNWGAPAVPGGMFIVGLWLRWLYDRWGRYAGTHALWGGFYVALLIHVLHFETNAAQWIAGFFKIWIVVGLGLVLGRWLGWVSGSTTSSARAARRAAPPMRGSF